MYAITRIKRNIVREKLALLKGLSKSLGPRGLPSPRVNILIGAIALLLFACDSTSSVTDLTIDDAFGDLSPTPGELCELPGDQIVNGGPGKDGIPALTNPELVAANEVNYLDDNDRIIGLYLDGQPVAIPHNILWWHEIMNYNGGEGNLAITYCPLTGSSIVFDRANIGGAELGVSGLLYQNNLIMYDRNEVEGLWSQMLSGAGCNSNKDISLTSLGHVEMTWAGWLELNPATRVVSSSTGFPRNYTRYPYGNYESVTNNMVLFEMGPLDNRRPPKERVLGIPGSNGRALTFPFGILEDLGQLAVVPDRFDNQSLVVLWDSAKASASAFRPETDMGEEVSLSVVGDQIIDEISGSAFGVHGKAINGALEGQRLVPVDEAYVAFWFAWPAFHPQTEIFSVPS